MLEIEKITKTINQLITPPETTWENDVFEVLLKQCPKELYDKYVESPIDDPIPSTSGDVRTVNADARVHYSQILGGLYLELAALLKSLRTTSSDEFQLISLQDITLIRKSFEFFLLAGILPFLEPGAGLPAASRSTFIKSWKLYDGNKESCIQRLDFAGQVIVSLLKSNGAIASHFLPKFIYDVLAVRFQLLELKVEKYETELNEIFSKCPVNLLVDGLMFLMQDRKTAATPKWLKVACGKHMTLILVGKDGVAHLLQYYRERAGENWTDNLPMTRQVAWHLATVPKMFKHPLQYHEIISEQFLQAFYKQDVLEKNMLTVFIGYVEQLRVRFSLNADITVFDKLLSFWEILDKKLQDRTSTNTEKIESFHPNNVRNLQLLSQLQSSQYIKRIRALFSCLIACAEQIPYVKDILKAVLDNVSSLGLSIYQYVLTPSLSVHLEKKKTSKIQEIGENSNGNETPMDELWVHGYADPDAGVSHRMETAFFVIDNVLSSAQVRTILEIMNYALDDFLKNSEKEREADTARFVQIDGSRLHSSAHAHLLIGVCFERLSSIAEDLGFSQEECVQLMRICESVLNNATSKFLRVVHRRRSLDIFQLTPSEKKEFEFSRDTARWCIPLITTIFYLTQGSPRLHDIQLKSLEAIANFSKAAEQLPCEDASFNASLDTAKTLLRSLKIDVNQVSPPNIPQRTENRRRYTQVDICMEWIEELNDDEPAIRGGVLMQIAKAFRSKTWHCQKLLDYGAFEIVRELLAEEDSYVYLAAINCLCEMGLYDGHLFEGLIDYYEELAISSDKSVNTSMRIGRLAEAIGKAFLVRGESALLYFKRMATLFMSGIDEPEEILRASCCGAFGNLLRATKGKGVEPYMTQLFTAAINLIRADRSPLVRRSATDLIRHCLGSAGRDLLVLHRENILDIHRAVRDLYRTDRDETVRLHAQLCLDEIKAALQDNQEETERQYRRDLRM